MSMKLVVFHEFAASEEQLAVVAAAGVAVDRAAEPNKLAKSDEELAIVKSNAKLFFAPGTAAEEVDAVLAKLAPAGLEVVKRNPVTSAGAPMEDRVILKLTSA
eukprot:CAMPEP_0174835018 /NCGR_PEP_ID=MMETSP1114-20130205/5182_1 /TAXON_ID=312471 /ORGANISM="Neobodo designis, Strain CCAP 1951/1" /LENGTH=102 /DNA_ID=CAMNT_0016068955 /DNA_START=42 /DNA_END=350 /DNA_ORIENTATION=+